MSKCKKGRIKSGFTEKKNVWQKKLFDILVLRHEHFDEFVQLNIQ